LQGKTRIPSLASSSATSLLLGAEDAAMFCGIMPICHAGVLAILVHRVIAVG
jgi:hypothetical protein